MATKKNFYAELAYVLGLLALCLGVGFMAQADFGLSMVVSPAYILHLKISEYLPFFTFGVAEYTLQFVLLLVMMLIVRKARVFYLFAFLTAFLYGNILDLIQLATVHLPAETIPLRILWFIVGLVVTDAGVSLMFHTYIAPEIYELFVMEVSRACKMEIHRFKVFYDCGSLLVSLILSFAFFGLWPLRGIGIGTVICTFCNGVIIGFFSRFFEKHFTFTDRFPWRKYFS